MRIYLIRRRDEEGDLASQEWKGGREGGGLANLWFGKEAEEGSVLDLDHLFRVRFD